MLERRLVLFLDSIKEKAAAYLIGDIFDFWHKYKYVVTRLATLDSCTTL